MSIGKDVTNRKPKFKLERSVDAFDKQQEKQARWEEGKLEEGQKTEAKKELKYEMPTGNVEAKPDHFSVLLDAKEDKAPVAGAENRRRKSK